MLRSHCAVQTVYIRKAPSVMVSCSRKFKQASPAVCYSNQKAESHKITRNALCWPGRACFHTATPSKAFFYLRFPVKHGGWQRVSHRPAVFVETHWRQFTGQTGMKGEHTSRIETSWQRCCVCLQRGTRSNTCAASICPVMLRKEEVVSDLTAKTK